MPKTPDTPPQPTKEEQNRRLWDVLGKTDPRHTKSFKRGGGFSGTAIKPMWMNKRLTEMFGPVGIGWGMDKPEFTTVAAQDGEVLVYCTVQAWYSENADDDIHEVYGVGGDKCVAWVGSEQKGNRRIVADDEAFKKAFTDALGNAFKFVGVAADVHMGLFDDNKYVQEVGQEFVAAEDTLGKDIDAMQDRIKAAASLEELDLIGADIGAEGGLKQQLAAAKRAGEFQMLTTIFKARKAALTPKEEPTE